MRPFFTVHRFDSYITYMRKLSFSENRVFEKSIYCKEQYKHSHSRSRTRKVRFRNSP